MVPLEQRARLSPLVSYLRCPECRSGLRVEASETAGGGPSGMLGCDGCGREYPVVDGTACLLTRPIDEGEDAAVRRRTAESFAYEWQAFGALRPEWERNFLDYMRPHGPDFFPGRLVLDVGAGSGRHSYHAHRLGARVIAVDLGEAIHVARKNLPPEVLTVQADAEQLPFDEGTFDLVASIGVLHHLPSPERALREIARFVRPGGYLQVYLYWQPPVRWHGAALKLVSSIRKATTRMPRPLLHALCYPLAGALFAAFVLPYRGARTVGGLDRLAASLPLKAYADYPFEVLVNDQFDRFSAPLERRFTAGEVEGMLQRAGLEDVVVLANNGWIGSGRRPEQSGC